MYQIFFSDHLKKQSRWISINPLNYSSIMKISLSHVLTVVFVLCSCASTCVSGFAVEPNNQEGQSEASHEAQNKDDIQVSSREETTWTGT